VIRSARGGRAAVATAAALAFAACAPADQGRGDTVLFASGADLQSINPLVTVHPLARQVQKYVLLTTLVRYDSALVPRPYLAREWRWSPDRRTLTLELVREIRWHDGRPTTAADVVWTLERARDPETGYPRLADLREITSVAASGDGTVAIRFAAPQAAIPDVLTDLAILPRHLLGDVAAADLRRAAWNEAPTGNGPFRYVTHEPSRRWVFAANRDFPAELGGPPRLERLVIAVVDEPTTKLAALASGELDFAGIQPAHAEFVRRREPLAVLDYPLLFTYAVVLNTRRPPFDDVGVRRALDLALDRAEIVEGFIFGFGTAATGPVPPGVPGGLPPVPVPHAPDSARALLAGRRPALELLTVGSGEAALEQMIQAQLAEVGFRVRIRQLELSAFLDRVYGPRREFDAAVLGIPGDLGLGYVAPLGDLAGIELPSDPSAAQRVIAREVPVAFLYHARGVQGANTRVRGVTMDVRGELATVSQWWIER
jgi:peptide/nickel transport system substrate-binding protein